MNITKPRIATGRLGSRKSTTGCKTCKIRKVKCDEVQPHCRRCTSTGRICDGYTQSNGVASTANSHGLTVLGNQPQHYNNLSEDETLAFDYFVNRVIPSSARLVDEQFWRHLLPQISLADPVVLNAVNAMAFLIKYPLYPDVDTSGYRQGNVNGPPTRDGKHFKALQWYGKSITGLRQLMKKNVESSSTTTTMMVTCVIYVCIECLKDNPLAADVLFQHAISVMKAVKTNVSISNSGSLTNIEKTVQELLDHMSATLGRPAIWSQPTPYDGMFGDYKLAGARGVLYGLVVQANHFIAYVEELKLSKQKLWSPPVELWQRHQHLLSLFPQARHSIEEAYNQFSSHDRNANEERFHVIMLGFNHYFVWLSTVLSMFDTAYDEYSDEFAAMIKHARAVIAAAPDGELRTVFSFETRVIPSMFFVATRCRHPIIRRQAMEVLLDGPEIENIWKSKPLAAVARKKIAIEESGDLRGTYHAEAQSLDFPPEEHRIFRQFIVEIPESLSTTGPYLNVGRWLKNEIGAWYKTEEIIRV